MELVRVKSLKELDKILPLIMELHQMAEAPYTVCGTIAHMVMNFHSLTFQVWAVYDGGEPVGYTAASIEGRYFERECFVTAALMKTKDKAIVDEARDRIWAWAKQNNCRYMSFVTKIDKMGERFEMDDKELYFRKEIGGT